MSEKVKKRSKRPLIILIAALFGAMVGGILAVLAYNGNWLG